MKKWGTQVLRLTSILAMAGLVLALPGCGGSSSSSGGGGTPVVTPGFTSNNGATAQDLVRFSGSDCSVGDICDLTISIGATTDNDYYAFAFDLLLADPAVAQFVSGSDVAGNFLTGTADSIVAQNGDRVVVGVSKSGQVPGNGTASETVVLTLSFKLLKVGSTNVTFTGFTGSGTNCSSGDAEAIDSTGACITSTVFGAGGVLSGS